MLRSTATPDLTAQVRGSSTRWALVLALIVCGFYVPQLATGTLQWDGVDVHYSSQRYFSDAIRNGRIAFWTPYVFAGFPFLADVQVGAFYPLNWPFFLAGITPRSITLELLLHSLIAATGAYALGLRLLRSATAGVAAGTFYALSGYFAAHSQHVGMFQAAAWLPWLVLLLHEIAERLTLGRLALAGLMGAALALPGHFQAALYAYCGAAAWAMLDAVLIRQIGRARRLVTGVLAVGVWGGLLAAIMVLPGQELVGRSLRARVDARAGDLGYFQPDSLATLVWPDYFGLLSGSYSGPGDVTQHYFYAGALLVPLAVVGMRDPRARRFALLISLPFLWYALGPPAGLFRLVARLPGFRNIELPMHGWFLPALGLAVLAAAGLGIVQSRVRLRWLAPLVLAATFADVLIVNQVLNPLAYARQPFGELYGAPLARFETQATGVERLYGPPLTAVGYRNHALQSRVETTYGYNPLELAAYADYADAAEINPRLIDGLAVSHRIGATGNVGLNPFGLPLAYFPRRITTVADEAAAREALLTLDPLVESVVVGPPPDTTPDPSASATLLQRSDDQVLIRYRSATPNVLRVAIPFFPGWHANLKGADLPIIVLDHALMGIVVPSGEGDIRLTYASRYFLPGAAISAVALLGVLAAGAISLRADRASGPARPAASRSDR